MRAERTFNEPLFQLWKKAKLLLHLRRVQGQVPQALLEPMSSWAQVDKLRAQYLDFWSF